MKAIRPAVFSLALMSVAIAPAHAQHFPKDPEVLALLQERVDAGGAVGIAIGLLEADGSIRTLEAGSAGMGEDPLSPTTLFEIGSITKVFTGTLLADMVGRGEVSLDDPVRAYLPAGVTMPSRNGTEITLADLSSHRSSLPRLPDNMAPADMSDPYADYTADMLYDFLSSHELRRDIGTEAEYSNLGAGLLGHVLAEHLRMTYEAAVRERILEPLGMDMTVIELSTEMDVPMAKGHDPGGDVVPLWNVATLAGAGGLRSNVQDMLHFVAANIGEPSSELERAMRAAHAVRHPMGESMEIGLNWITRTTDGRRIVWHNGGTAGFRTFIGFDPDAEVGVVVLTNSGIGADDIGFHLLNRNIPLAPPPVPGFLRREVVDVDRATLERYVGEYALAGQTRSFGISRDGDALYARFYELPPIELMARSKEEFSLRWTAAKVVFDLDAAGAPTAMTFHIGGDELHATKK